MLQTKLTKLPLLDNCERKAGDMPKLANVFWLFLNSALCNCPENAYLKNCKNTENTRSLMWSGVLCIAKDMKHDRQQSGGLLPAKTAYSKTIRTRKNDFMKSVIISQNNRKIWGKIKQKKTQGGQNNVCDYHYEKQFPQ